MSWWKLSSILSFALLLSALGCGSGATNITLTVSPATVSVPTNTSAQFTQILTGTTNTVVSWSLTCQTGVTAPACGTINAAGLYTAPATVPTVITSGVTTVSPNATITATSQADASITSTAVVTIITGISVSIVPTSATVGTSETYPFSTIVNNPGCDLNVVNNTCLNVNWSVPTSAGTPQVGCIPGTSSPSGCVPCPNTNVYGCIDGSGIYHAPTTAPSPSVVAITATSVVDTSVTATAIVEIVTAQDPTLSSVSPKTVPLGSLFEDIYITGTNFISTNNVFINGTEIPATQPAANGEQIVNVAVPTTNTIRARIPTALLSSSTGVLQVTVSRQTGTAQNCTPDITSCQIILQSVRPTAVGPSPNSIPQGTNVLSFNVDGGFFGTPTNPTVNATYDGSIRVAQISSTNPTRQLSVTIGGAGNPNDLGTAGLHQVDIVSDANPTKFASANIAIQPNISTNPPAALSGSPLTVGSLPSDVAINPATGVAVVANTGSNSVSVINLTTTPPSIIKTVCTANIGLVPPCPAPGPQSVAVDYVQNIALVTNNTGIATCPTPATSSSPPSCSVAVIDLNPLTTPMNSVTSILATQDAPVGIGVNPISEHALVSMNTKGYGLLLNVANKTATALGPVTISSGGNSRVAVEPNLNWAIATPGGAGSIGIVDLNRQTTNTITAVARTNNGTTNEVTVTVAASSGGTNQPPLSVVVGDTVQIQGVSDSSFDGFYTVSAVGPGTSQFIYEQTGVILPTVTTEAATGTVNYAQPIALLALTTTVQGVSINTETEQAILTDPSSQSGNVSLFSLLDQSVTPLTLETNNTGEIGTSAAAFNPLTNIAVTVNKNFNQLSVLDPTNSSNPRLNGGSPFPTGSAPVAVAIDPGTDTAVVANQQDGTVTILSLGAIRPFSVTGVSPTSFTATSTLSAPPAPAALTLTVYGYGFTTSSVVRFDGVAVSTTFMNSRELTALITPALLSSAHRFTVDVQDPGAGKGISNASDFTVIQSINVASGTGCQLASPLPSGVAIDAQQNIATVSLAACATAALINLSNGTGQVINVGNFPIGAAAFPSLHMSVVANNQDGTASVIDELGATVTETISTGTSPFGMAADQDTGEAASADEQSNTSTVMNLATQGTVSVSVGQGPISVAFNYQSHQVATANTTSNSVTVADAASGNTINTFSASLPSWVLYDAWQGDCPTGNLVGCFLVAESTDNEVGIFDPTSATSSTSAIRVGINPTAIAYNPLTSTLISTNAGSHTITVADFLGQQIRAVLTLPPPPVNSVLALTEPLQFAVDVNPVTNLAVIADTANGDVLLVSIPR